MRLSLHTDYALRALIYLAARPGEAPTAGAIARAYGISKHHLVKVLQRLRGLGYLATVRGRSGGVRLACSASEIRLGDVVRRIEPLEMAECFDPAANTCPIVQACLLKPQLGAALAAYLKVLDGYTVADIAANRQELAAALSQA